MRAKEKVGEGAAPAADGTDADAVESGLESATEPTGDADTDAVVDDAVGEIGCGCAGGCGGGDGDDGAIGPEVPLASEVAIGVRAPSVRASSGARCEDEPARASFACDTGKAPGSTYVALRRARSLARRYAKTG